MAMTKLQKRRQMVQVRKGQPTPGDVHINTPLTNISVAWMQSSDVFVADKVFPQVPVSNQSDVYYEYNRTEWLRDEAKPRSPASESAGGGFTVKTSQYACKVEAFHKDVDDQLRANADSILQLDRSATEFVSQRLMLRRERQFASTFFKAGVWANDVTPATKWDAAGADPVKDLEAGKLTLKRYGFKGSVLLLGAEVVSALRTSSAIRDQYKYTSADSIDLGMIASYFGVERVLELSAVYSPENEGAASPTTQFIFGKHALFAHVASAPSLMTPTAGYIFTWSGFTGSTNGVRTKKFRMENIASDRIEGEQAYDMKIVSPELGYFMPNVIS